MDQELDFSALADLQSPVASDKDIAKLRHNAQVYETMAAANGLAYRRVSLGQNFGPGTLFTVFGEKKFTNCLGGNFADLPFEMFHFTGINHGKYKDYVKNMTVFRFTLPRFLPQIIIDSHLEDGIEGATRGVFSQGQKITFEGDFSQYFTVYAAQSYQQSAVNILAPDIMQALLKHASRCDIEIIDNFMYFYWPKHVSSPDAVRQIFATAGAVMKEMRHKLVRSNIFTTDKQQLMHAQGKGARLQRREIAWILVLCALGFILVRETGNGGVFLLVFVAILLWRLFTVIKRRHLRKAWSRRNNL